MASGNGAGAPANPVKDVTTASFKADVIAASARQPVLVDFWAPWCGPCKQLGPVLEKAVADAKGKVALVKMNIDDHPQIAGQLGIQSIPAVIAFDKGQPIDGFMGALPESQVRGFIERLVGPLSAAADELLAQAEAAARQGRRGGRGRALRARPHRGRNQPQGDRRPRQAACRRRRPRSGQGGAVDGAAPPPAGKDQDPAIAAAWAAVHVAEQAAAVGDLAPLEKAVAENPDNHQARFDLALALNAKGRRDEAADSLLAIIKRDRKWNDEAARKQLAAILRGLGPDGPGGGDGAAQIVGDPVLIGVSETRARSS